MRGYGITSSRLYQVPELEMKVISKQAVMGCIEINGFVFIGGKSRLLSEFMFIIDAANV